MRARGFTLIELSIVMTIAALVVAGAFAFGRTMDAFSHEALAQADAARAARSVSEELRRDLRTKSWVGNGLSLSADDGCRVEYAVEGDVLVRRLDPPTCGDKRAVARHVASVKRDGGSVELVFQRRVGRAERFETRIRLGMPR